MFGQTKSPFHYAPYNDFHLSTTNDAGQTSPVGNMQHVFSLVPTTRNEADSLL